MICQFCKDELKGITTEIASSDEKVNCCNSCMDDIIELMESGALEQKLFKSSGKIGVYKDQLVEEFNGRIRYFENARVESISKDRRAYRDVNLGRRGYSLDYPYEAMNSYGDPCRTVDLIKCNIILDPSQETRYDREIEARFYDEVYQKSKLIP